MSETTIKINTLLSDLSAYFVRHYGMSPRDAAGFVMQSSVAEEMRKDNSPLQNATVEQLAAQLV